MDDKTKFFYKMVDYIGEDLHDEDSSLYGEGILRELKVDQVLIRVEATQAEHPGDWFHGPFTNYQHAKRYADYLLNLGKAGIRKVNALPRVWPKGYQGNPIDVIRFYRVANHCPGISSVVAPQRECGTIMARPEHLAALLSGDKEAIADYPGQGQQLAVPVKRVFKEHGIKLVERMQGCELPVAKL